MVDGPQSSDLVDPLLGYSTVSLFPRTFRDLTNGAESEQQDMESIHSYLKSMALRSPNKLLEQAKTILSSSSELMNSEFPCHMQSEDGDGAPAAKGRDRPQERRPALGRKRARFSLKPMTSSLDVDPNLNIDQLEDPEEYFLAHERLENAKKELQKQRGDTLTSLNQYPSTTARLRRPGLLGKTVSYKHHYPSRHAENDEMFLSSQDTLEVDFSSPPNSSSNPKTADQHGAPEERKIDGDDLVDVIEEKGSVAESEKRVGNLFHELLSANGTDLDGDGMVIYLQERLRIKPIDLDELCLPSLDSIARNDLKAPVEQLPRPRKALSDIHNMLKRENSKKLEAHRQVLGHLIHPQASPHPPKSPLASLSFLNKRISQMNPPNDPFSVLGVDTSPARHSSPVEDNKKQDLSPHVDANHLDASNTIPAEVEGKGLNFSGKLPLQWIEEDTTAGNNVDSEKMVMEDLASSIDRLIDENSSRFDTDVDVRSNGSEGGLKDKAQVEDVLQEAVASELPELIIEDQSGPTAGAHCPVEGHTETTNIAPGQNNETNQVPSGIPLNVQSEPKAPSRNRNKRKELSHRQSLAGAGSLWESGVRRSNRIKIRPLEYWNGERFLYGRIHGSLATVIGLKYVSPAKGKGKPAVRVKSYVSDEYKDLVEQAALH